LREYKANLKLFGDSFGEFRSDLPVKTFFKKDFLRLSPGKNLNFTKFVTK